MAEGPSSPVKTKRLKPFMEGETEEMLERSCSEMSQETTTELLGVANSTEALKKMEELLPVYFYSWQLQSPQAVIVYLLLRCFILRRDYTELRRDRLAFEEHIERLKSRIGELEEEVANGETVDPRNKRELGQLTRQVETLTVKNENLQQAHDEVYMINQQWASDYESLRQQIVNTTGCYSAVSTSTFSDSFPAGPGRECVRCPHLERQLTESQRQVSELSENIERLEREMKSKVESRERMIEQLEHENRAIQYQLQEIGDLQQAMKVKQDYERLRHQFVQLNRQHSDVLSERLRLQKQLDKVRQAFLEVFPYGGPPLSSRRERPASFNTVPRRSCRRQHYEPPPPTPPGLIARGDHLGSLVETDFERLHVDEQVTGFEPHTWHGNTDKDRDVLRPNPPNLFQLEQLKCPRCSKMFNFARNDMDRWFDHVQFCGV